MKKLFSRPEGLTDTLMRYCPGCGHGFVHRIIGELLIELGIRERTVGIAPVGCSVFADEYFNCDMIQPPHGRGPAVSAGIKRARPECIVFSYQGDGDLGSIGTAEIIHAAARNENITVVFINNAIFGMTGGQMAPTTLPGMKSTTSPKGRDVRKQGYPIKVCEMLASLDGPYYLERCAVDTVKNVVKTKRALKMAFQNQLDDKGFCLIEVLSMCPTGWGQTPVQAKKWMQEVMSAYYPLGVYRDRSKEAK
jgi:2-oxoglutarate ferredoxin oxidoreductase subunit beta